MSPTLLSVRLAEASRAGVGPSGTQSPNIPLSRSGTLAKALTIPTLNPAPGPAPGQTAPPSCLPALGRRGKAAFSRFILKDASKSKQSRCSLIEKINYGKMCIWLPCPCPSFASPPRLAEYAHLVQLPLPDSGEGWHCLQGRGQPGQCQVSSQRLCLQDLQVPQHQPLQARPQEGEHLQALCPQRTTLPGPLSRRHSHRHPASGRVRLLQGPPAAPQVTLGSSGQEALPWALSSFTELGGQPRVPGRGAGRWRAAGAEGTAGWLHTVRAGLAA